MGSPRADPEISVHVQTTYEHVPGEAGKWQRKGKKIVCRLSALISLAWACRGGLEGEIYFRITSKLWKRIQAFLFPHWQGSSLRFGGHNLPGATGSLHAEVKQLQEPRTVFQRQYWAQDIRRKCIQSQGVSP